MPRLDSRSFVERYAPTLIDPLRPTPLLPPPRTPSKDLLETYLGQDLRQLYADAEARPKHYSAEQHQLLEQLRRDQAIAPAQRSELLLQLMRRTEAQRTERDVRREITQKIVNPEADPPPFERQESFRGAIRLI